MYENFGLVTYFNRKKIYFLKAAEYSEYKEKTYFEVLSEFGLVKKPTFLALMKDGDFIIKAISYFVFIFLAILMTHVIFVAIFPVLYINK